MEIYKINSVISTTPYGRFNHYYTNTIDLDNQLDMNYEKIDINFFNLKLFIHLGNHIFTQKPTLYFYFKYNEIDILIMEDLFGFLLNKIPKTNISFDYSFEKDINALLLSEYNINL